jgi:phosphoribosyl-dephospho-CoA transferase
MPPLRRHQLAHLSAAGWGEVLSGHWEAAAHDCLRLWARRRLPLVVTRQRAGAPRDAPGGRVALGLPAPLAWERCRIALDVPREAISRLGEFPHATEVLRLLPRRARAAMVELLDRLAALGVQARAYGGYGWQIVSGQAYVHADSDLDLWVAIEGAAQADAVAACLLGRAPVEPRLDGELLFADGAAVAWREWAAWRTGRTRGLLVKRLNGPALAHSIAPPGAAGAFAT